MNDFSENTKYLIALSHFLKLGPVKIKRLRKYFPDFKTVFCASVNELMQAGIEEKLALEFISKRQLVPIDKILDQLDREDIGVINIGHEKYPKLLAEIYDPPEILYYRGNLNNITNFNIAIVGSRKYTDYGAQATETIVKDLVRHGLTIVSGLALGIDTVAHNATIKANGCTIAVLGTGINNRAIYPAANKYLADKIIASGGLIFSEFPLNTPPLRHHFPQRNRIVAGLSLGTLVVEAAEKSGALITSKYALDQNREVFAIPGNIYSPVSIGPNNLIKQGAKAVTSADDIIETLNIENVPAKIVSQKIITDTLEEKLILKHLNHEPIHINDIIRTTNLSTSVASSTLIMMEIKGLARNVGGMKYVLGN
ncbi:DNA-processing protein DprA [Candidatus Parcubacteria bacterium]|nr:DNA-processing protein DprA [Patescibacteria group bacterium]MBU4309647.1 DNA-processing protein DprA [Patescibacteria group bacterium]MBU4432031.1 DNA-processing protein DprA [Patescibacteria group bacterium]MBU4577965.1 DNA-processing protein DprA [Patescibacteria group bacterium]MCG2696526.1 DNA-processing protein DprA [Candidatus Parcubacteria bacterium]